MIETIKEFVIDSYEPLEIVEIADKGCITGCASGLIYYEETVAFHDKHETEIWEMLWDDANDNGVTVTEFISKFNGHNNVASMDQFKNMLTWYAVERVCGIIVEEMCNG